MTRIVVFLLAVVIVALAAVWLADRPGDVAITWLGWQIETSVSIAAAALAIVAFLAALIWSAVGFLLRSPRLVSHAWRDRRRRKGMRSLSRGLVAVASGDAGAARKFAAEADRLAEDEPLTLLLRAQTAQLAGDRAAADAAFRAMAGRHDTRVLGLRGLYVEAQRRGDGDAARRYAEQAAQSARALPWAGQAMFDFRCAAGDWTGALEALEINVRGGLIERAAYRRHRAVLLTARALEAEEHDAGAAKALALEAAKLAPDLVPAASMAARLSAESGEWRRAGKILDAAWRRNPHPDLADIYAHLRRGDAARARLARVHVLARLRPGEREGALAIAGAALEAQDFAGARAALAPLLEQPTQRVAMLMAQIEEAEHDDAGRAREWMGRALRAPRDPCWTADGMVSERWLPVSPVSGRIDAFEWKIPFGELVPAGGMLTGDAPASPALDASVEDSSAQPAGESVGGPDGAAGERLIPRSSPQDSAAAQRTTQLFSGAAAARASGRRSQAVIPLMHAPDDPGPERDAPPDAGGSDPHGIPAAIR